MSQRWVAMFAGVVLGATAAFAVPPAWTNVAPFPTDAYGVSATNDGTNVYAGGGYSFSSGGSIQTFAKWDPTSNTWTPLASIPDTFTAMASMVYGGNGKVYMFGGDDPTSGTVTNVTRIYTIGTNTWSAGAPMSDLRAFMASGFSGGNIYVVGGYNTGNVSPAFATVWAYNVAGNSWNTSLTSMPLALGGAGSAIIAGKLYVAGGRDATNTVDNTLFAYDIAGNSWTTLATLPSADNVPGAGVVSGQLWIFGGGNPFFQTLSSTELPQAPNTTGTCMLYDPPSNVWSSCPSLITGVAFPGSTTLVNSPIAIGGYTGSTTTTEVETNVNAPTGGCSDYNVATTAGVGIVPGTTFVTGSNCDDCSVSIPLPFTFSFYGSPFATVNAISNGSLQFSSAATNFTNACLPFATFNNAIVPYWDDLYQVNAGNGIYTSTSGVAPNRIFNIEWRGQYFPGSGTANFEVRLHETSGQIDFVYGTVTNGNTSATGGLQQGTGAAFKSLFCNGTGQALSQGLEVTYTCAGGACTITCPANVTQGNDAGLCSAVVNFPAPTTTGQCGAVSCAPPSGSVFAVGTTPDTCSAVGGPSCGFNVTVNDVEPPVIAACPADINDTMAPGLVSKPEVFTVPTATDNCPGVGVVCVPPSGSLFLPGTTVDTCTATDAVALTDSCSFNVNLTQLTTQEIPTLSHLGLAALGVLLAGGALLLLRRRT